MPGKRLRMDCPLSAFVNLVSGKWAIPLLYRLIVTDGAIRFRELQRLAQPITQKELTKQLRLLEERGLVRRTVFDERPARVEYEATPAAKHLIGALEELVVWMRDHGWGLVDMSSANKAMNANDSPGTMPARAMDGIALDS